MDAAAKKKDPEKDAKREARRQQDMRQQAFRNQAARAIIVANHNFNSAGSNIMARMVCASYDDVLEYGRMYYGTEDVVLLDQWGHVIEDAGGKKYFAHQPMHMANGKHVKEGDRVRYVEYAKRDFDVQTVCVATFRDLEVPICGPCKKVADDRYVTGPKDNGRRFEIFRDGPSGAKHTSWNLQDCKTGLFSRYNARKKDALAAANKILRTESCAAQIAAGFTDLDAYL